LTKRKVTSLIRRVSHQRDTPWKRGGVWGNSISHAKGGSGEILGRGEKEKKIRELPWEKAS